MRTVIRRKGNTVTTQVGCKVRYQGRDWTLIRIVDQAWTLQHADGSRVTAHYFNCAPYANDPYSCTFEESSA